MIWHQITYNGWYAIKSNQIKQFVCKRMSSCWFKMLSTKYLFRNFRVSFWLWNSYYEVEQIRRKEWWKMSIWIFLLPELLWTTSPFSSRPKSLPMVYYKGIMTFSHGRSLSLVGGSVREIHFKIGGDKIPTIREKPVKNLGRLYSIPLTDRHRSTEVLKAALKHGLLPRILWPLLYEIVISRVERI